MMEHRFALTTDAISNIYHNAATRLLTVQVGVQEISLQYGHQCQFIVLVFMLELNGNLGNSDKVVQVIESKKIAGEPSSQVWLCLISARW